MLCDWLHTYYAPDTVLLLYMSHSFLIITHGLDAIMCVPIILQQRTLVHCLTWVHWPWPSPFMSEVEWPRLELRQSDPEFFSSILTALFLHKTNLEAGI